MLEPTHFGSNGAVAASVVELFCQETSAYSAMVRSVENFLSRQKMVSTPLVAMQLRPVICIYLLDQDGPSMLFWRGDSISTFVRTGISTQVCLFNPILVLLSARLRHGRGGLNAEATPCGFVLRAKGQLSDPRSPSTTASRSIAEQSRAELISPNTTKHSAFRHSLS